MKAIVESVEGVKKTSSLEKKNVIGTLLSLVVMFMAVTIASSSFSNYSTPLGQSVSFNKQGLAKVDLPYLNITVGMQQYREQERRFLLGHNDLSSLLRWKYRYELSTIVSHVL